MRQLSIFIIFMLLPCYVFPNSKIQQEVIERNNHLYIISCNKEYPINDIITVKYVYIEQLQDKYHVIRNNKLKYADLLISNNITIQSFVSILEQDDNIVSIDYNGVGSYNTLSPNDTHIASQWHLPYIHALDAWTITTGCPYVKIGILDSGTDWMHPDLGLGLDSYQNIFCNPYEDDWTDRNNPASGNNYDDDGNNLTDDYKGWNYDSGTNDSRGIYYHGTFVAGVVGAKTNNNFGVCGIAGGYGSQGVSLVPYCVGLNSPQSDVVDDAIIDAVDNGMRIIQLSLSVSNTAAIRSALQYAADNDVIVVCAAGNTNSSSLDFPASNANVIAVGAMNQSYQRASFSNYGTNLSVVAPGVDIHGLNLTSETTLFRVESGTSFAAPQVSGTIGLMLSVNPNLTRDEVRYIIESTAQKLSAYSFQPSSSAHPNGTWNKFVGYGLLDAYSAVLAAKDKYIQNRQYLSGESVVESYPEIYAGYSVTDVIPYGDVVIQSGSNVTFKATRAIHLNPGFRVEPGATFYAIIETPSQTSSAPLYVRKRETHPADSNNGNADVAQQHIDAFSVSPNPVASILYINTSDELSQAKIYTINGQCVLQSAQTDIDVSALPQGMYILRAETTDGNAHQTKFIKQ